MPFCYVSREGGAMQAPPHTPFQSLVPIRQLLFTAVVLTLIGVGIAFLAPGQQPIPQVLPGIETKTDDPAATADGVAKPDVHAATDQATATNTEAAVPAH